MGEITVLSLSEFALASGAVGTASMGISEGFKSCQLTPFGFNRLKKELHWADEALTVAYGDSYSDLLESLYRLGRKEGDLPRILRQGVRIGMNEQSAKKMACVVGDCPVDKLSAVAKKVSNGETLNDSEKNIIGRFEIAADARIDAALSLADRAYVNGLRLGAFIISMILSLTTAFLLGGFSFDNYGYLVSAFIVGIVAVPLAPIAKDVATGLQSAAKAIRGGK